jgi:2-polyprenyl-3-methyl-5-hydroxy-6-metoxy-1,4-benzoquinol methylase
MSAVGDRYRFSYGPGTPYAHAVGLIERWRAPTGEMVVDLGCGFGPIAEPVRDLGLTYLGVDVEAAGLRSLESRGFEGLTANVCEPVQLLDALAVALAGRRLAAFVALDCIEHLPNSIEVLTALFRHASSNGSVPLVVSIPNVSHRDVAVKLLLGRWDVTPTGLLDVTHVRFFAPSTLSSTMAATGWNELEADDFELDESDQHFPDDCPALLASTPVGALLRRIREAAAPGGTTNQFVRAYSPRGASEHPSDAVAGLAADVHSDDLQRPFLSVLVPLAGPTASSALDTFEPLVASLCMQASRDFEVVISMRGTPGDLEEALTRRHRALEGRLRVVTVDVAATRERALGPAPRTSPEELAVQVARGRYVAFLGAADVTEPHWVSELIQTAARAPGRVIDAGIERGAHLLGMLVTDPGPLSAFAFPRSIFVDMGVALDQGSTDWKLVIDGVRLCGLSATTSRELVSSHYPTPVAADALPDPAREEIVFALDQEPLLLDCDSATLLVELHDERDVLARACENLQMQLTDMRESTSWRATAPLRAVTGWWRHR